MKPQSIRIQDADLRKWIEARAEQENRSFNWVINEMLEVARKAIERNQ